jgi:hypothetical protein
MADLSLAGLAKLPPKSTVLMGVFNKKEYKRKHTKGSI